MIKYRF